MNEITSSLHESFARVREIARDAVSSKQQSRSEPQAALLSAQILALADAITFEHS